MPTATTAVAAAGVPIVVMTQGVNSSGNQYFHYNSNSCADIFAVDVVKGALST